MDDAAAAGPAGVRPRWRPRRRPAPAWLGAGLHRPLAEDDDRARSWVQHVHTGVLLSEIAGLACLLYTATTPTPGHRHPVLLALAGASSSGRPCCSCCRWTGSSATCAGHSCSTAGRSPPRRS
ncbi:hypothetical protein [Geodermatophilus amargosae]|uniref:hypothetical protein n=1 Tax=Geodermatophilus amargosae TaxID=1296565 RepID=UPI001114F795|nr:hypothetical protein [Geodermatophilus amargosae]